MVVSAEPVAHRSELAEHRRWRLSLANLEDEALECFPPPGSGVAAVPRTSSHGVLPRPPSSIDSARSGTGVLNASRSSPCFPEARATDRSALPSETPRKANACRLPQIGGHVGAGRSSVSTAASSTAGAPRMRVARPASVDSAAASSDALRSCTSSAACEQDLFWQRGEELGAGSYGSVYLARRKDNGRVFAVKIARLYGEERKHAEQLQQELDIVKDLQHKHIVSCLGHDYVNRRLYIYLEYVPGGSLRRYVGEWGLLEGPLLWKAVRGMLKGLNYLHTHKPPVVHRDLKGANVLVDLSFCVKLADFGCSKRNTNTMSFSEVGSLQWVAPEVITQEGHGRKADIWSLGCVVAEIATAADPWGKDAFSSLYDALNTIGAGDRTPPIPPGLSEAGKDFLSCCLQRAPETRSDTKQLLRHCLVRSSSATSTNVSSRAQSRASGRSSER